MRDKSLTFSDWVLFALKIIDVYWNLQEKEQYGCQKG